MPDDKLHRHLSHLEAPELIDAAAKIAGFDLGKRPTFGTAANVSGVRTRTQTFSRRRDSLTIFASDNRYGHLGRAGAWTGADRKAITACRRVLRAARIPAGEIGQIDVLSEHGVVAERLAEDEVRVEEPQLLRKLARGTRGLDGLPVWSSHVVVGLTAKGEVGQLELHWPHLAPEVVKEAKVLQAVVDRGFEAPDVPGARPEWVEAGIVHSPPIGFYMDITAAIRVVYVGDDPTLGRKPARYLDRHAEPVAPPRDIDPARPDDAERTTPGEPGATP
jgi:hypothetical protein